MDKTTNTGGPAFADPARARSSHHSHKGMTLRDWFAGQAVHGLLEQAHVFEIQDDWWIAERAYRIADAMLAEREKGGSDE
jgi:hypothetical protein